MDRFTGMQACSRMKGLALLLAAIILLLCACAATPGGPSTGSGEAAAPIGSAAPETDGGPSTGPEEAAAPIGSAVPETEEAGPEPASSTETSTEITEEPGMKLRINETEIEVLWEDNESVSALRELAKQAPLTVQMSPYGGFEQVGPIGQSIPRNDVQTVTEPGDIVLYSGNQIVVFYGSNSWAYTRLGKIQGMNQRALTKLLGNGAVTLTLSLGAETAEHRIPDVLLNSGYSMPVIGLGTWALNDAEAETSVYHALKCGMRLIDTARYYGNEVGVGRGLKRAIDEGIVTREEVFLTSKIYGGNYERAGGIIDSALSDLNVDYIDLLLIHKLGEYLNPNTVYNHFKEIVKRIGAPELRFHDMRHSYAVAALQAGDDVKTVQGNLGHATAAFTLDVYGHVTDQMKEESANRMERFIQRVRTA